MTHFKICHTVEKRARRGNYSLQRKPTSDHNALPEPIQFFVLGAMSIQWKPPKREPITRGETLANKLNLEKVLLRF